MPEGLPLVFDGHNDTVLSLRNTGRSFFERGSQGHLDLPRAREGGFGGGFFAVYVPNADVERRSGQSAGAFGDLSTMPPVMELGYAQRFAIGQAARLFQIERESNGEARVVRTAGEIEDALEQGALAMLLHLEGAEPLDSGGEALELFYQAGFRSLGVCWSRPNAYAQGVPFKFPSTPDHGPGLSEAGQELVRRCNALGVMLDVSHLNEQGFWDLARLTDKPIVATHSNAHAICPSTRNLTDKQLDAIRDSNGMVGLNFSVGSTNPSGSRDPDMPLSMMLDQIDYLVEKLGIDRVGLGSDFDGTTVATELGDVAGLPKLLEGLQERGYDEAALAKLAHRNWVRVLRATWGA
ncbi:MAG TPA: dipeptidase [Thermomicrobiaceae bacterium]|nr:dipeptidase [Thermomicrobiaceae bacterium]